MPPVHKLHRRRSRTEILYLTLQRRTDPGTTPSPKPDLWKGSWRLGILFPVVTSLEPLDSLQRVTT
jgi:hypothetical protein